MDGSVPEGIGDLLELVHINLEGNYFVSSIPSSVGQLPLLVYLFLSDNHFTGTLPESLSLLNASLQDLNVGDNELHGTIPSWLGLMSNLNTLVMSFNYLTGAVPSSLSRLSGLRVLQLDGNYLISSLDGVFSPAVNMTKLQVVDVSDNALTGSIPAALFENTPLLSTVSMSLNCMSGSIPAGMCSAKDMLVLSLDGMGSSADCDGYGDVFFNFFKPQGLRGTIPACVLTMPSLLLLHLSANALTGSIPDGEFSPSLRNISLSHNHLSSTIPYSFQRGQLRKLDLSHNKLTGVWQRRRGDLDVNHSPTSEEELIARLEVKLTVNRLSGDLPSPIRLTNIDVLKGNLFGCGFSLPEHDPSRRDYLCGSSQLDQSLYFLLGGVCFFVGMLAVYAVYRWHRSRVKESTANTSGAAHLGVCQDVVCGDRSLQSGKIQGERSSCQVMNRAASDVGGGGSQMIPLEMGSDLFSERSSASGRQSLTAEAASFGVVSLFSALSSSVYLYVFFLRCLDENSLPNIRQFQQTMQHVARSVVLVMTLGVFLSVPVFALKLSEEGKDSFDFTTHTHTYG